MRIGTNIINIMLRIVSIFNPEKHATGERSIIH